MMITVAFVASAATVILVIIGCNVLQREGLTIRTAAVAFVAIPAFISITFSSYFVLALAVKEWRSFP